MQLTSRTTAALVATGIALGSSAGCSRKNTAREPIRVAAAADLTNAFEELGKEFERRGGQRVDFVFGSTGLLARQLAEGAPYDVFAAANVSFVDRAVASGACDATSKRGYARGKIVLWAQDTSVALPKRLSDLANPKFKRIAIANPDHAPYGMAAKQALRAAGIWERVKERVVYGENVRQTLQLAESGNVEVAIVALSLAKVTSGGHYVEVEENQYAPIEQALVVCGRGHNQGGGRAFADFVASAEGRSVLRRYGFVVPDEPDGG